MRLPLELGGERTKNGNLRKTKSLSFCSSLFHPPNSSGSHMSILSAMPGNLREIEDWLKFQGGGRRGAGRGSWSRHTSTYVVALLCSAYAHPSGEGKGRRRGRGFSRPHNLQLQDLKNGVGTTFQQIHPMLCGNQACCTRAYSGCWAQRHHCEGQALFGDAMRLNTLYDMSNSAVCQVTTPNPENFVMHRISRATAKQFQLTKGLQIIAYMHAITLQCPLPLGHSEGQKQASDLPIGQQGKLCLGQAAACWISWKAAG